MRTDKLFMLWTMLYNHPVNIPYYLLNYLVSIAKKKLDDKGDIVVGGITTFIARKFEVGEEIGINKIEGNIYLSLDTLASMFFLKPHGYTHNFQFEWKVNNANCLIILPNPDITNPGWWRICFILALTHRYMIMVMMVVMKRTKVHTRTMNKKLVGTIMMNGGHGSKVKFKE